MLIERLETPNVVRVILPLGKTLPRPRLRQRQGHPGPPETIERVLAADLPHHTGTTITGPAGLRAEPALIRERGYAVNDGEWREDITAVAAAVLGRDGRPIAALSISDRLTR